MVPGVSDISWKSNKIQLFFGMVIWLVSIVFVVRSGLVKLSLIDTVRCTLVGGVPYLKILSRIAVSLFFVGVNAWAKVQGGVRMMPCPQFWVCSWSTPHSKTVG